MDDQEKIKIKPLSQNAFVAFFQKIARRWLGGWYTFSEKHKKLAPLIYKFFFFMVFSASVTIWQYIVMTFLPYAFKGLNDGPWGFPETPVKSAGGQPYVLFGDASGLGYFIAFEIAVFTAQCINFPLQRNITFKSHGNPYFQAMWYFIGWVLISVFTNALWGIINCYLLFLNAHAALIGFVKTALTGGISFVIFFFIFLLIFPDRQKQAKSARAKLDRLIKKGAGEQKIAKSAAKCEKLCALAESERIRKEKISCEYLASSKAIAWDEAKRKYEKMQKKGCPQDELDDQLKLIETRYSAALEAAQKLEELNG